MFQFPGLATSNLCIQYDVSVITHGRLPDSETSGLTLVSSSPELFAAVHVLLRLLAPRHPPRALRSLTVSLRHASSPLVRPLYGLTEACREQGSNQELEPIYSLSQLP
jgi:hypothetical protein